MNTYPVIAEVWTLFEGSLQIQAKRLVEDIAKQQQADPKPLWAKVKPQIKIGILDLDIPEKPTQCSYPIGSTEGAVKLRCRCPCLLGFETCSKHAGMPQPSTQSSHPSVDRILDQNGYSYFVDSHSIARDRNGIAKGYVDTTDGILYLFEVVKKEALIQPTKEE